MQKYGFALIALITTGIGCGDSNTNDFVATDNPLRCGSEGVESIEVARLRQAGRPSTIEEAEAAPNGLLLRIENAIAWKRGARDADTVVHLNARLCGTKESQDRHGKKQTDYINCHDLPGTVNQNETETFYLTIGEAFAIIQHSDNGNKAALQYKLTTQVSSIWYPGGQIDIDAHLDNSKQNVSVRVVEACQRSYRDTVQYSIN